MGTTFRELIARAGGATVDDFGIFVSGLMMGTLTFDLDDVVTKTTGGLILLPRDHYLMTRKTRSTSEMAHIGKSACDQCSYCTEFCPRYLLGYEVQPHKVMRSLGFTLTGGDIWNQWSELCCACGLCTLYACPEDLYPKEACDSGKQSRRAAGLKFVQQAPVEVHPMKEYRRVPLSQLRRRLQVEEYERETPFEAGTSQPAVGADQVEAACGAGGESDRGRRQESEEGPAGRARRRWQTGRQCACQHRRQGARGDGGLRRDFRVGAGRGRNGKEFNWLDRADEHRGRVPLACDAMLKAADVEVVLSRSICSGKYMVMVRGDVAAVQAAVAAGIAGARFSVIDSFVIPNLHEAVFPAISGTTKVEALEALGIVESFSVASLIEGADAAVKSGERAVDRDPPGDGAGRQGVRDDDG